MIILDCIAWHYWNYGFFSFTLKSYLIDIYIRSDIIGALFLKNHTDANLDTKLEETQTQSGRSVWPLLNRRWGAKVVAGGLEGMEKIKVLFTSYNPQDIWKKEELRASFMVSRRRIDLWNQLEFSCIHDILKMSLWLYKKITVYITFVFKRYIREKSWGFNTYMLYLISSIWYLRFSL